jgi:hypothetical protein
MAASSTSASVRFGKALASLTAASAATALLLAIPARAEAPGGRTFALTPLEERQTTIPELSPGETPQPVLGYLRLTEDGWKLDMLPGAVRRTGPLPVLTQAADVPPEYPPALGVYPYAPLFRIDF